MRILCITFFWKNFIFHAIKCPLAALYAYVLSLTQNKYDTEDVLQETYVSIAENANSYRGGRKGGREVFLFLRGKSW